MTNYYDGLPIEAASQIEGISRTMYELRESRARLLQPYAVEDESGLLDKISSGALPEHPAYEHYLGACAISKAIAAARETLQELLKQLGGE